VTTERLLVLVTGSGPGLGKSTLARTLAGSLIHSGRSVELFQELDIEDHADFADVMREFTRTGEVARPTLLDAARRHLRGVAARQADVVIFDALFAFLPSLLAWGCSDAEINGFFEQTAELFAGSRVLEIHLRGNLRAALSRAVAREGGSWLSDQVKKIGGFRGAPPISTPEEAIGYLEVLAARTARLLEGAPWMVTFINADQGPRAVSAEAESALLALLP
jgi:hypothetical protein